MTRPVRPSNVRVAVKARSMKMRSSLRRARPDESSSSSMKHATPVARQVSNIEQVVRDIRAAGFEPLSDIQTVTAPPLQGMRVVYVRDPDGVALELIQESAGVSLEDLHLARLWTA
jgi:hypothetical protein